jgi:hypothetical protein
MDAEGGAMGLLAGARPGGVSGDGATGGRSGAEETGAGAEDGVGGLRGPGGIGAGVGTDGAPAAGTGLGGSFKGGSLTAPEDASEGVEGGWESLTVSNSMKEKIKAPSRSVNHTGNGS